MPNDTRSNSSSGRRRANERWIADQSASPEARREYEEERLIVWCLDEIAGAMERAGLTSADVARKLDVSRAHITQIFRGSRNVTLRTLADLAWACDSRLDVRLEPLREGRFISSPVHLVKRAPMEVVTTAPSADEGNTPESTGEYPLAAVCG